MRHNSPRDSSRGTQGYQARGACPRCGATRTDGQIGLEPTLAGYIAEMVAVFAEVRRVLREDGTAFLNLGDSFARDPGKGTTGTPNGRNLAVMGYAGGALPFGLKSKDLCMVPHRVAIALQEDGWWVRQDNVWSKRSCMPESVTDRTTRSHEYVFQLTKSASYFYDSDAIAEEGAIPAGTRAAKGSNVRSDLKDVNGRPPEYWEYTGRRNKRSVWTLGPEPFAEAHFAVMPATLAEICIKAGSSERGCCPACGAPWGRVVEKGALMPPASRPDAIQCQGSGESTQAQKGAAKACFSREKTVTGWRPTCECPAADPVPCLILDPFSGAGTTALVADRLGRNAIGIELNPKYVALSEARLRRDAGMFAEVTA